MSGLGLLEPPERELEVLTTPNVHPLVVGSQVVEILPGEVREELHPLQLPPVYGEEAAGHSGRSDRIDFALPPTLLVVRNRVPRKLKVPIESGEGSGIILID